MKIPHRLMLCLLALLVIVPVHATQSIYYVAHVAARGRDAWPGTLEKPFATLQKAQNEARKAWKTPNMTGAVIYVHGGFYPMAAPLTLTAEDKNLTIEAYKNETPVLSGGTRITGFRATGNRWEVTLPKGTPYFSQLYVNGSRRFRPRVSNGYLRIAQEIAPSPAAGDGFDRFQYPDDTLRGDWHNLPDVEIVPFQTWAASRFGIKTLDEKAHVVTLTGHTQTHEWFQKMDKNKRFLVENVYEFLKEPGQWYFDRATNVLTYLAKPGENPITADVVVPRLPYLVSLDGAKNVTLRGLTFAHSAWNLPKEGYSFVQAEIPLGAAVRCVNTSDCVLERCNIRHTGEWGLEIGAQCRRIRVRRCELTDLGAGGVKIGLLTNETNPEKLTSHNEISDCLIAHAGRIHSAGVGIFLGHTPYNTITHNDITDLYYTGISPGWLSGYGASGAHHNIIAYNRISHIGQGVLSDMGGIYTLGVSPGTVLHHNVIHDVDSFDYGGWGIYFDEGTTGITAENNVVYRTKSAPFHQHFGKENIVQNNIFAFGREAQLMRTRAEDHLSFTLRRNIVYWENAPLLGSNWSGDKYILENNLYWDGGKTKTVPQDKNAVIADPLFVAPNTGDFRLRPGSPAARIGFVSIDTTTAGRRGVPPYKGVAERAFPPPPPPPAPEPIADGFESVPPGGKPLDATVYEDANVPAASIRITNETANTGRQSLRFTDAPGQTVPYNPHMAYAPRWEKGVLRASFALNWSTGAKFYHEWRDAQTPYNVGVMLRVGETGELSANGRKLTTVTGGVWATFAVRCVLGSGTYVLTVTERGKPAQIFTNLPCVSGKAFRSLRWWGFVSEADANTLFFLDDLSLKAE